MVARLSDATVVRMIKANGGKYLLCFACIAALSPGDASLKLPVYFSASIAQRII